MAYYGPPPFQPQPVRRKSNAPLWITIILAVVLVPCGLLIAAIFYFKSTFWDKSIAPFTACTLSFRDVKLSLIDYADANGGKFPNADNWEDAVRPYYAKRYQRRAKNEPFAPMNPNSVWGCEATGEKGKPTGMAFNSDLSGKKLSDIKDPYSTVLIYEIPVASHNAHGPYKEPTEPGPAFLSQHRNWMYAYVKGNANPNDNFNVDVNDEGPSSRSKGDGDSSSSDDNSDSKSNGDVHIHIDKKGSSDKNGVHIHIDSSSDSGSGGK